VHLADEFAITPLFSAVALGARSLADLQSTLGVATCCGRCADCASGIVREASPESASIAGGGDD